ncbi:hypothetical protein Tco_1249864, partial [Tanacetum coccineum]
VPEKELQLELLEYSENEKEHQLPLVKYLEKELLLLLPVEHCEKELQPVLSFFEEARVIGLPYLFKPRVNATTL